MWLALHHTTKRQRHGGQVGVAALATRSLASRGLVTALVTVLVTATCLPSQGPQLTRPGRAEIHLLEVWAQLHTDRSESGEEREGGEGGGSEGVGVGEGGGEE